MRRKWLAGALLLLLLVVVGLFIAASIMAKRVEPYVREQTIAWLEKRFSATVEIGKLDASLPGTSPLKALWSGGRNTWVKASGDRIRVRMKDTPFALPLLELERFEFEVELASLRTQPVRVRVVNLKKLALNIPPRGARPKLPAEAAAGTTVRVQIDRIVADNAVLTMIPKDEKKAPLVFDLHELRMTSSEPGTAMNYETRLTNPKPRGEVKSSGRFGPFDAADPGSTPLAGVYRMAASDLSVFKGIAGMLTSEGRFSGALQEIVVDGTTDTPDFRLTMAGNPVPLKTKFHAVVDGTNGDTHLDPVEAKLGNTVFDCRGDVARFKDQTGKTVALHVNLRGGVMEDLLRLAMKGDQPIVKGGVAMRLKFELPPGRGEIADRLKMTGSFALREARFTSSAVQDKIDELSRKGQGKPKEKTIDEVPSRMEGDFAMARGKIDFSRLQFTVPGSAVDLAGSYDFGAEWLDFHGKLRLQAKVSQTQSGWKRIVLKPVDPFFSKEGAGTLLKIAVTGTRANPKFGLDKK